MKHIRELGTRWQIRFTDSRRHPKEISYSFDKAASNGSGGFTRKQIQQLRDELRVLWQRGEWDPWSGRLPNAAISAPVTILQAVNRYCDHKRALGKRGLQGGWNERTYRNYKANLRAFATQAGANTTTDRITTKDFEKHIFRSPVPATRQMYRRQATTFLSWMKAENLVSPDLTLPPAFVTRRRIKNYITEPELEKICKAHLELCEEKVAKKHAPKTGERTARRRLWMVDAFRLAFYQAMRLSEVLSLRVGAVDLKGGAMRIGDDAFIPKGKDEHVVTITPPAAPIIERHIKGKKPHDRLFPFDSPGRLSKAFKAAAKKAELLDAKPDLNFHSLRRSGGYFWAQRGVPILDLKDLMRHKSVRTTETYYVQQMLDGQADRFRQAYRQDGEFLPEPYQRF